MSSKPARLRRSSLAVPGASEKMLAKAAASNADQVLCDLEDAVPAAGKADARHTVVNALKQLDWGKKVVSVRVNDPGTQWCHEDIITLLELAGERIDTIILPKALDAADVLFADKLITQIEMKGRLGKHIGLEVLIEDVRALENVREIARCSQRLECLIFGAGDYAQSQGVLPASGDEAGDLFAYPRTMITVAARAAGIEAIDGPSAEYRDMDKFARECRASAMIGMTGKWAIHPAQIAPSLAAFSPLDADVPRARAIVAAYQEALASGAGTASLDGTMLDAAIVKSAEVLLAKHAQIAA